jgi:hypothetical protein
VVQLGTTVLDPCAHSRLPGSRPAVRASRGSRSEERVTPTNGGNPIPRYLGFLVLGLIIVLIGLRLDRIVFPVRPCPTPEYQSIDIADVGQGAQASEVVLHRSHPDLVRWVNHTDKAFHLVFKDKGADPDDNAGPFDELKQGITVAPKETTGYFRIEVRAADRGKVIRYSYTSDGTEPLKGPPGDPGMVVEE